ncbi:MAG: hypothetical protein V4678_02050 [Patescibacteria group bacterium]
MAFVEVTVRGVRQSLSLSEARELLSVLPGAIKSAEQAAEVSSPDLTYGHLTRASLLQFFAQLHDSDIGARTVASKLLASLVRVSSGSLTRDQIGFDIVHAACGKHVSRPNCDDKHPSSHHPYRKDEEYFIEAQSLVRRAESFMDIDRRNVGPMMRHNFKLLIEQL